MLRARSSTANTESPEEAYAIGERSVLYLGDRAGETAALDRLGLALWGNVEDTTARKRLEQALSVYQAVDDADGVASVEAILAEMEVTK